MDATSGKGNKLDGLLRGEVVEMRTYSTYHSRTGPRVGTFYLTNFRVVFISHLDSLKAPNVNVRDADARIQLGKIFKISKYAVLQDIVLEIWCKDFQLARFSFISEGKACDRVHKALHRLAFPPSIDLAFAFQFKSENAEFDLLASGEFDGWKAYDPIREYARMGIPDQFWRLSASNQFYKLCSSYPRVLVVPAKITDAQLKEAANFRTRERIPVLSWRHPTTKAALSRSSQPRVGWGRTRSSADEELIAAIRRANPIQPSLPLSVIDARSKIDAAANQAMGAGSEGLHYENTKLRFMGVCNAPKVAEAANKLLQLVHSEVSGHDWLMKLSNTRWLEYISLVMSAGVTISRSLEKGHSVHVHCSDGWDRTVQLVTLAMLLSDPYYRTLEGFAVLVEKEWLSFGHKFEDRLGHASIEHASKERSPIFVQWIDCVYQLIAQFPTAFEFNEHFIITLIDAVLSLQYGTFLCDSERHRVVAMLSDRTESFWSEVHGNKHTYTNVYYNFCPGLLKPQTDCRFLSLWTGFYLRWSISAPTQHLEMGESDAKILQTVQDKQNLQQVLSQSHSVNEELKEKIFSLANDNMKQTGEVTFLYQKMDSLLELLHRHGDVDLLSRAQAIVGQSMATAEEMGSEGLYASSGSNDSGNHESGYYSDHEETSPKAIHASPRKSIAALGRSLSDGLPAELLEKRRINRSNSDIAKANMDNKQEEFNLHEATDSLPNIPPQNGMKVTEPSNNGPAKTLVRNLISSLNYSVSSDDNDNDERETDSRSSHPHHGARRWRQISQEKQALQQENKKLKDDNQELLTRATKAEQMLENEKDISRRLAASRKSLIQDLTIISESPPLNIQCDAGSSSELKVETFETTVEDDSGDYLGNSCTLGGSDVRVFPDYTAIHRERCEIELVSMSNTLDKWCAGCDGVLKGNQFLMVRVSGKSLPHCKECAHALVSLTQRIGLCYACGRSLNTSSASPSLTSGEPPHCAPCARKLKERIKNLGIDV